MSDISAQVARDLAKELVLAEEQIATLQSDLAAARAERSAAYNEAHSLAVVMHRRYFYHNLRWEPLDTTAGIISQIDNMFAGLGADHDRTLTDLAAAREELARAREALIAAWKTLEYTDMAVGGELPIAENLRKKVRDRLTVEAESRYAREIAKVCTYPDCSCCYDMGVDNKCWQGYAMPVIAHNGEEG
jgi:hypothetical protein